MSKAYSCNLTQWQWELIEPLIPPVKPGGRNREVEMWSVVGAKYNLLSVNSRLHMEKLVKTQ